MNRAQFGTGGAAGTGGRAAAPARWSRWRPHRRCGRRLPPTWRCSGWSPSFDAEFSVIWPRRTDAGLGWLTAMPQALPAPLRAMVLGISNTRCGLFVASTARWANELSAHPRRRKQQARPDPAVSTIPQGTVLSNASPTSRLGYPSPVDSLPMRICSSPERCHHAVRRAVARAARPAAPH